MSIADLQMESAATVGRFALIVKLHPRRVVVKARAFPVYFVLRRRDDADKRRKEVNGAVQRTEERP